MTIEPLNLFTDEHEPIPVNIDVPPPGFDTYLQMRNLLEVIDRRVEDAMPLDIAASGRLVDDIVSNPHDIDGVLDEEFRWHVAEVALQETVSMYEIYNFTPQLLGEGYEATNRGFSLCGPIAAATRMSLWGGYPDIYDKSEISIRLYRPTEAEMADGQKPEDQSTLLLRTGDGLVHYIDPTANLFWGPKPDFGKPWVLADIPRHEVYREEELDERLSADYQLHPFPTDPDDPVWQNLTLFEAGSGPHELEALQQILNSKWVHNDRSVAADGNEYATPFYGNYMAAYNWRNLMYNLEMSACLQVVAEHKAVHSMYRRNLGLMFESDRHSWSRERWLDPGLRPWLQPPTEKQLAAIERLAGRVGFVADMTGDESVA